MRPFGLLEHRKTNSLSLFKMSEDRKTDANHTVEPVLKSIAYRVRSSVLPPLFAGCQPHTIKYESLPFRLYGVTHFLDCFQEH